MVKKVLEVKSPTKFIGARINPVVANTLALQSILTGTNKSRLIEEALVIHLKGKTIDELTDDVAQLAFKQWPSNKRFYKKNLERYIEAVLYQLEVYNLDPDVYDLVAAKVRSVFV